MMTIFSDRELVQKGKEIVTQLTVFQSRGGGVVMITMTMTRIMVVNFEKCDNDDGDHDGDQNDHHIYGVDNDDGGR